MLFILNVRWWRSTLRLALAALANTCSHRPVRIHFSRARERENRVTKVVLRSGESPESLLKRFRKKVTRDRILSDAKKKRFFVSGSEKRRIALRKAVRRERKRRWKELERRY